MQTQDLFSVTRVPNLVLVMLPRGLAALYKEITGLEDCRNNCVRLTGFCSSLKIVLILVCRYCA